MNKYYRKKKKKSLIDIAANFLINATKKYKAKSEIEKKHAEAIADLTEAKKQSNTIGKQKKKDYYSREKRKTSPEEQPPPEEKKPPEEQLSPEEKPQLTKELLLSIEWYNYEKVCVEYLKIKNINAQLTGTGADKGIDINIANSEGKRTGIAQCKAWNRKIGVNLVRELYGVMASEKLEKGIFFTTSIFTQDAIEFCRDKKVLLINLNELINRINKLEENEKKRILAVATNGDYTTPTCASCNQKMVKRIAKKGKNVGSEFWGCSNFPRCRSTIQMRKTISL